MKLGNLNAAECAYIDSICSHLDQYFVEDSDELEDILESIDRHFRQVKEDMSKANKVLSYWL